MVRISNNKWSVLFIFFFFFFISCQKERRSNNLEINKSKIISCNFPDTIKLNRVVEGNLQYDISNIDFDKRLISSRFLHLILTTDRNKKLLDYDQIEKDYLLGFVDSIPTGKFNFKAVFEKKGKQTLNIAIRDHMFLKTNKNTPKDKIVLRTSDCLFSKEVYVID